MRCPDCGAENHPDAGFCAACSSRLPDVPFLSLAGDASARMDESQQLSTSFPSSSASEEETIVIIPPESDYSAPPRGKVTPAPPADGGKRGAGYRAEDKTQAIEPVSAERLNRIPRVICPECYAYNPERNHFCHECGSPLPMASLGPGGAVGAAPRRAGYRPTAVLPAQEGDIIASAAEAVPLDSEQGKTRGKRGFGAADGLALPAVAVLVAAMLLPLFLESFSYKKGLDLSMFAHQGAYVRGAYELLGGPGLLPYRGMEFVTVGLLFALGLFLAALFLLLRVGRGPMFVLAGCLVLFPLIYLFFQAVLPLRQMGVEIEPAVGLERLFFGGGRAPGLGPPIWMATAAGVLLIIAGFVAPPRGWGRLFTFLVFFSLAVGAAFFCAACYNWNLFISESAAGFAVAGPILSAFLSAVG